MSAPSPTPAQRRLLEGYLDELEAWNRRLNLTTVGRAEAWQRHVEESLLLLERAAVAPSARCIDIGSGGGIPGVVIAVVRPDLEVTLLESDRRKAGFLVHVCGLLGLRAVTVVARRAEEIGHDPDHRERHDVAVSRAAAPPARLCELALPLLRSGGELWALVGEAASSPETVAAVTAAAAASGGTVRPSTTGLLTVRKTSLTPPRMPRRNAGRSPWRPEP